MTKIELTTTIKAPTLQVFDANRNIDLHQLSTSKSHETAVDGTTSGLINLNETVTWRGKHFGIYLTHKSLISEMQIPNYFVDEMVSGKFKSFKHQHLFREENGETIMTDTITYQTPFGIFGELFNQLVLKKYLTEFIVERNEFIKQTLEKNR